VSVVKVHEQIARGEQQYHCKGPRKSSIPIAQFLFKRIFVLSRVFDVLIARLGQSSNVRTTITNFCSDCIHGQASCTVYSYALASSWLLVRLVPR